MSNSLATIAPIAPTEQVVLEVSGFQSFTDLNAVRKAVSRLPGVSNVQPRSVRAGSMYLLVTYAGMVPFDVHLDELIRGRGRELPAHIEVAAA
jgi:hypothetical protein